MESTCAINALSQQIDEAKLILESLNDSPSVILFTTTVSETVQRSKILQELFDFSGITLGEYANGMFKHIFIAMRNAGAAHPSNSTQSCINPILKYHKKLNSMLVLRVNANTIAKDILLNGFLNEENAEHLALKYVDFLEKNANLYNKKEDPEWRFKTLTYGFVDFLKSLHLVTKENALLVGIINGNEWEPTGDF
ncbi:hypothetical protein NPIL_392531 [Nephila pilipes]|uniref:Uncharacterized protein n=1 Tax=Nephila pilipes TaxID=299642 RepID=A0A8X6N859_NEPPI|nr:hypothetical protein NPIL_392531 [Nephila pilipes]